MQCVEFDIKLLVFHTVVLLYMCVAFVCKLTIIIINNCHNLCVINLIMHCFGYPFSAVCIFDALA